MSMSNIALATIAQFIEKQYGKDHLRVRQFKSKSKLAQEAHEAIRPSYIDKIQVSTNRDEQKLYELIRLRTLASQMTDAQVEKTDVVIHLSNNEKYWFEAHGEIIIFDGFMTIYKNTPQAFGDVILPEISEGDVLTYTHIQALQRFSKPPARFTEATLVKKLEELGIGRPSTYAPTIEKITSLSRGYVSKETRDGLPTDFAQLILQNGKITEDIFSELVGAQKNKLFANDTGMVVTDFLEKNFDEIMDYSFTAEVEDKLDDIARSKEDWVKVVDTYYKPFTKTVESTLKTAEKATGERELGKDPKTGRTILVRLSKYGAVVQIGKTDELGEDEKPQYAGLMPGQSLDTITIEDAFKLFELPRSVGTVNDKPVVISRGRFGPYIKYGDDYISIPKNQDLFALQLQDAKIIIEQKIKEKAPIGEYLNFPITKGAGRFGPYIKWNDLYVSINKRSGYNFASITEEQAIDLIQQKQKKDSQKLIIEWKEEGIRVQKGKWGPFIKKKGSKRFYKLPKNEKGDQLIDDEIKRLPIDEIKKIIKAQS